VHCSFIDNRLRVLPSGSAATSTPVANTGQGVDAIKREGTVLQRDPPSASVCHLKHISTERQGSSSAIADSARRERRATRAAHSAARRLRRADGQHLIGIHAQRIARHMNALPVDQ
jgi:hypothetical protein